MMKFCILILIALLPVYAATQTISTVKSLKSVKPDIQDSIKKSKFMTEDTLMVTVKRDNIDLTVYPNPFKRMTTVSFTLHKTDTVSLKVLDVEGRMKQSILKSIALPEGDYIFEINAEDLVSDFYIVQLSSRKGRFGKKVLLKE